MVEFFDIIQLEYLLRIIVAAVCGILIGAERRNRSKEAGIRTHCIVACAAALIMIISKYGFFDLVNMAEYGGADVRLDPSRVASTIASSIGFLGAGMIFVHKNNTVSGLTTAAGIWATSGVGMAIGAGMYFMGITVSILIIIAQYVLHMNIGWLKPHKPKRLTIHNVNEEKYQQTMTDLLNEKSIEVKDIRIEKNEDGNKNYTFLIDIPNSVHEEDIISEINYKCKISE